MTILAVILTVLCSPVFLVWSARHLAIGRAKRDNTVLTADSPGAPVSAGKVSILIAAKDEEETIEACVRSMLMQDYADFEVIVINDRSGDRTAEIVQRIADQDPRLRLLNVEDLPEGWSGKNHAMWRGAAVATGDWLCLSDADCRQTSGPGAGDTAALSARPPGAKAGQVGIGPGTQGLPPTLPTGGPLSGRRGGDCGDATEIG